MSAVQSLMLGDADFGAGRRRGKHEPRLPISLPDRALGRRRWATSRALDMMLGALNCPFGTGHMGVTAENVAGEHGITPRRSGCLRAGKPGPRRPRHRRGPVQGPDRAGRGARASGTWCAFDTDEHPKATSAEALAGLRAVFQKDGTVTAGNACGINDGAAALVLARAEAAEKAGLKPARSAFWAMPMPACAPR